MSRLASQAQQGLFTPGKTLSGILVGASVLETILAFGLTAVLSFHFFQPLLQTNILRQKSTTLGSTLLRSAKTPLWILLGWLLFSFGTVVLLYFASPPEAQHLSSDLATAPFATLMLTIPLLTFAMAGAAAQWFILTHNRYWERQGETKLLR